MNKTLDSNSFDSILSLNPNTTYTIIDPADYIIPPNEFSSLFIMTNYIRTEQTQGYCDEEITKPKAKCKTNDDCKNLGSNANSWNGTIIQFNFIE